MRSHAFSLSIGQRRQLHTFTCMMISAHHAGGSLPISRNFACRLVGALHFGTNFTHDLCLYPENFTFKVRVALHHPTKREKLQGCKTMLQGRRHVSSATMDIITNELTLFLQVVNSTASLTPTNRGRVTTGLEYYYGAFGTTVTLDEIIDQVGPHQILTQPEINPPSASCSRLHTELNQGGLEAHSR